MKDLKIKLHRACIDFVDQKAETIDQLISSYKKDLNSETKSSAGDKHETGRAMLQLEMEKASQQLHVIHQMKETLSKITVDATRSTRIKLGSIVCTNHQNFYIAISTGEIKVDKSLYFAVSSHSPIGSLLLGKQEGDTVKFKHNMLIKTVY